MYTRRAYLGSATVAIAGGVAGCLGQSTAERLAEEHDVRVEMRATLYDPESVTVETGASIVWHNKGDADHTVTAYEDEIPDEADYFASGIGESESEARDLVGRLPEEYVSEEQKVVDNGLIESGGWYHHTLDVPGEYAYFCEPHEKAGMTGTITVKG